MIFVPEKGVKTPSFDGDTLIIPIVSTGNVGQLAVDLFITTGQTKSHHSVGKVGYLDTDLVAPVAGYEVFGPGQPPQLCVNLELYRCAEKGVTMLQQRGPVFLGEEQAFAEELVRWALDSGFKSILALSGADAAEGLDPTPLGRGAIKRFRAKKPPGTLSDKSQDPPSPCALEDALQDVGIGEFNAFSSAAGAGLGMSPIGDALLGIPGVALGGGTEEGKDGDGGLKNASGLAEVLSRFPHLPTGTGIAGPLCQKAMFIKGTGRDAYLPLVLLLHFCGEGDNTPEAVEMANAVNTALGILSCSADGSTSSHDGLFSWSSPLSWASLYGPPPGDDTLAYQ